MIGSLNSDLRGITHEGGEFGINPSGAYNNLRRIVQWTEHSGTIREMWVRLPLRRLLSASSVMVSHLLWEQGFAGSSPVWLTILWAEEP